MDKEERYERLSEDPTVFIDKASFLANNNPVKVYDDNSLWQDIKDEPTDKPQQVNKVPLNTDQEKKLLQRKEEREKNESRWLEEQALREAEANKAASRVAQRNKEWEEADAKRTAEKQIKSKREAEEYQRASQAKPPVRQPVSPARSVSENSSGTGCILPIIGIIVFIAALPLLFELCVIFLPVNSNFR